MTIVLLVSFCTVLAIFGCRCRNRSRISKKRRALADATAAGAAFDDAGNINASASYATILAQEEISGEKLTGKQAEFKELTRLIAEGPQRIDEIRFLLDRGFEPVVRPDGLVYVPCPENDHLYMVGEIPLAEEDLDSLVCPEEQEL